jgi:hypothetical protein
MGLPRCEQTRVNVEMGAAGVPFKGKADVDIRSSPGCANQRMDHREYPLC